PGFLALRQRVQDSDKTHEPLVIAANDQSRWSRQSVDSLQFYAFVAERPWIDLKMCDGSFERSPSGEFNWGMMAVAAHHLRKVTAVKIRDAYAHRIKQGLPTGPAPYGYRYANGRAGGQLELDPATAPIVRRIFADYADG